MIECHQPMIPRFDVNLTTTINPVFSSQRADCIRVVFYGRRCRRLCDFDNAVDSVDKGVREENVALGLRICRFYNIQIIRIHILLHCKRHDIRLQHHDVPSVGRVQLLFHLRLATGILVVHRAQRSD